MLVMRSFWRLSNFARRASAACFLDRSASPLSGPSMPPTSAAVVTSLLCRCGKGTCSVRRAGRTPAGPRAGRRRFGSAGCRTAVQNVVALPAPPAEPPCRHGEELLPGSWPASGRAAAPATWAAAGGGAHRWVASAMPQRSSSRSKQPSSRPAPPAEAVKAAPGGVWQAGVACAARDRAAHPASPGATPGGDGSREQDIGPGSRTKDQKLGARRRASVLAPALPPLAAHTGAAPSCRPADRPGARVPPAPGTRARLQVPPCQAPAEHTC